MKFIVCMIVSLFAILSSANSHAAGNLDLISAVANARKECHVLFDRLVLRKGAAGWAVGLSALGTGLEAGATVAGAVGAHNGRQYEETAEEIRQNNAEINRLRAANVEGIDALYDDERDGQTQKNLAVENSTTQTKIALDTVAIFANTLSVFASAIVGNAFSELVDSVQACSNAVNEIPAAVMQYKLDTGVNDQNATVAHALRIVETCGQYDLAKVQKLRGYTTASMIVGAVGATSGIASGIVTAKAAGEDRHYVETKLLTAGTAVSGAATAASATGLALNAVQLRAVQELSEISAQCAEALEYDLNAEVD